MVESASGTTTMQTVPEMQLDENMPTNAV